MANEPVITLNFADDESLRQAYMPFILGGGLFIQTTLVFAVNDMVRLTIALPDCDEVLQTSARVVWLAAATNPVARGVGVQFIHDRSQLRHCIERQLGPLVQAPIATLTM